MQRSESWLRQGQSNTDRGRQLQLLRLLTAKGVSPPGHCSERTTRGRWWTTPSPAMGCLVAEHPDTHGHAFICLSISVERETRGSTVATMERRARDRLALGRASGAAHGRDGGGPVQVRENCDLRARRSLAQIGPVAGHAGLRWWSRECQATRMARPCSSILRLSCRRCRCGRLRAGLGCSTAALRWPCLFCTLTGLLALLLGWHSHHARRSSAVNAAERQLRSPRLSVTGRSHLGGRSGETSNQQKR